MTRPTDVCRIDLAKEKQSTATSEGHVLIIWGKFSVLFWGGLPVSKKIKLIPLLITEVVEFFSSFQFGLSVLFNSILLHRESLWRTKPEAQRGSFLVKQRSAGYLVKRLDFQFRGNCTVLETPEIKNSCLQPYLFNWRRFTQFQNNYLVEEKLHTSSMLYTAFAKFPSLLLQKC